MVPALPNVDVMQGNKIHNAVEELLSEIRRLQEENAALRQQVRRDRLTGIHNQRALEEFIEASRFPGYYIFCDMDDLGKLNKTLGHDVVNEYIREFGEWLAQNVRGARITGMAMESRKHGDEFLCWCSNKKGAMRIRNAVRAWRSQDGRVTCSAGIGPDKRTADMNCTLFKERRKGVKYVA